MAEYIVKNNQNIFDIALELYGSIEGIFDLLISNENLGFSSDLRNGDRLVYHEDFIINESIVRKLKELGIVPVNSERHVYYKKPAGPVRFIIHGIDPEVAAIALDASGDGLMVIDWNDNTALQKVNLSSDMQNIAHSFDNIVDQARDVYVYGDFNFLRLDVSESQGEIRPIMPIVVDEFVSRSNDFMLYGLFLFEGTYKIDLQGCEILDLSPIQDMSLQVLDLRGAIFLNADVIDDYLVYISKNYGNRRDCTVYLSEEPSQKGMQAIQTILNEPAWNTSGKWKFIINGKIYTAA